MNNLLSHCGLIVAKIRASDKDLPLPVDLTNKWLENFTNQIYRYFFDEKNTTRKWGQDL